MDGVEVLLLGIAGDAHLVFASASLSVHALLKVGLGVPHHITEQLGELSGVFGLFPSITFESLSDFRIAFAVGLTAHRQIHAHL